MAIKLFYKKIANLLLSSYRPLAFFPAPFTSTIPLLFAPDLEVVPYLSRICAVFVPNLSCIYKDTGQVL